ncbi:unnamed protein product [Leptidea sinapis]|uniref:Uncharacterized protein n=1 Tax=Leptidea sinapis TaxID=189913 RepID=A0A5E4QUX1_9NEOP|nr:unnamed protein product [Leptidea sinapis]
MASSRPGICAGCRTKITSRLYLNCCVCKLNFDIEYANVSEKRFNLMEVERRNSWKCPGCVVKKPKIYNSNTPVRPTELSGSSPEHTKFSMASPSTRDDDIVINKGDIRLLFKEEFALMKDTLIKELHMSLKSMVEEEFKRMRNDITSIEEGITFMNAEHETMKQKLANQAVELKDLRSHNTSLQSTIHEMSSRRRHGAKQSNLQFRNSLCTCFNRHINKERHLAAYAQREHATALDLR